MTTRRFRTPPAHREVYLIAQNDPDLLPWLSGAREDAGHFLKSLADAGLRADGENYKILRPTLLAFKAKYPQYHEDELTRMIADGYNPDDPANHPGLDYWNRTFRNESL